MLKKLAEATYFLLAVVFGLIFGVLALLGILYSIPKIKAKVDYYD
jgi:hypothetical protein